MVSKLDPRWSKVTTYSELLKLNAEYVSCMLNSSPYCTGSIQVEDPNILPMLYKLHKYGILTTICETPKCHYHQHVDVEWGEGDRKLGKWYEDREQKECLCFYINMDNDPLAAALTARLRETKLIYTVCDLKEEDIVTILPPSQVSVVLSRFRHAARPELLPLTEWTNGLVLNREPNFVAMKWDNVLPNVSNILRGTKCFIVVAPEFCKRGIVASILEMCIASNANSTWLS